MVVELESFPEQEVASMVGVCPMQPAAADTSANLY